MKIEGTLVPFVDITEFLSHGFQGLLRCIQTDGSVAYIESEMYLASSKLEKKLLTITHYILVTEINEL